MRTLLAFLLGLLLGGGTVGWRLTFVEVPSREGVTQTPNPTPSPPVSGRLNEWGRIIPRSDP